MKFKTKPRQNEISEVIYIGGDPVGEVWEVLPAGTFQCQFDGREMVGGIVFANGAGKTKEEAVRAAVKDALVDAMLLQKMAGMIASAINMED